ncbi:cytochrome c oxidase subunit I [Anaeromyxobacter dehalogenans]|uniref:Cytochrome c oxidase subunit 1 n=1 Tax=Anaeromyxobacter dehalogenans (strain 2CP-C) TaxID=290397 RepID=Q2IK64_ANADE|nr:cytochrome c oxidase subunit I [Anaeromyxobacter dehalogenans]ABC82044.1 cytochrome-c oxidase [Anaeromyxobacter dehalogenans 2CP-C]
MSTAAVAVRAPAHETGSYLEHGRGVRSWLFTLDHKRIGIMYLVAISACLLLGGVFALVLRMHLWSPQGALVSNDAYNKLFTLHGAVMIFLFIIPGIPAALGNFVLPLQLGAKDLAFPRVNLLSFWLFVAGAIFFLVVLVVGGVDTGWTLYPPYSLESARGLGILLALSAVVLTGFSSILTGVNFIATIHRMRPPGMGWFDMPLFLWALYATGVIQIISTPVLGITAAMGFLERIFHLGLFMPEYGGDPILFQHFFWFYSHPAVYIMILPAMGVVSEVVSVFSRKPIFGYRFIAVSSMAIAIIGFLVWGHHMFVSGQSRWASLAFSFLTMLVSIPSAIKTFNWIATMYKGAIVLKTPMVYVLTFFAIFGVGGLTGLFLGLLATDVPLHDTYFVVAHFHFVMVGAVMIAFLAGLHYWWPKMTGRMYHEGVGVASAWLVFLGFNLTFVPQFLAGVLGMPRRYATYAPQFTAHNRLSTVGAFVLALGLVVALAGLLHSLRRGRRAPPNPWGAASLEWTIASPPTHHNFDETPRARGPYDYSGLHEVSEDAGWVREEGR